ncbi:YhdP family protein [Salinisphaera sp. Q1T1-3]|uniref:YhdP family protein n=1 Tax=Salinisphaera sp. Q1T1-3 TaxID=2321229 RepID=UPI000E713E07|nr:YhdP family protein [Salinisphaera sp. Q1T1-3]RJS93529.1 TIGR02099 family protein [Salinisphaera sp. Q1T1-3]
MSDTRPRPRRGWFKRTVVIIVAGVLVAAGLLVGGVRLLDHFAPQYRNALVERIGARIDADIHVDSLSLGWGWHGPILYLSDVRIVHHGRQQPALTADKLGFEFSLSSLLSGQRLPDGLIVSHPAARLVSDDGQLHLADWPQGDNTFLTPARLAALRRTLARISVRDARIAVDAPGLPGGHGTWNHIDLSLANSDGNELLAQIAADGPDWLGRVSAHASLKGALDAPTGGRFSAHLTGLDPLAVARTGRSDPARLAGGKADLSLDGRLDGARLVDTRLTLASAAVQRADANQAAPLIPAFRAVFDLDSDPGFRHITARLGQIGGALQTPPDMAARATFDTETHALTADARHLPSALVLRLARWRVPQLADTDIQGTLPKAELNWHPDTAPTLDVSFADLRVDDPALAFGPLDGRYRQSGGRHSLVFEDAGGTLSAKRYLNGQLAISGLSGGLDWQRRDDGTLAVHLDKLTLASREARVSANGTLALPGGDRAPVADIQATASAPNIARLLDRLPQAEDLPNPRLRDWLPKAITAGTLDKAEVTVRGPLDRFPFANARAGQGFHATLRGHDLDVDYKPGWPALKNARGTLQIDGATMDMSVPRATMIGVTIDKAHIHVPDVREPILSLTGSVAHAPADRLLAFLGASPLKDKFGTLVDAVKLSGPADLSVNLKLPLKSSLGDPAVHGTVTALGDTLTEAHLPGPLTAIRGPIRFSGDGLSAQAVSARLLGVPLTADLSPGTDNRQRIVAHARPTLPADQAALAHYVPAKWLVYGQGPIPLTVSFSLGGQGAISPITIDSDLQPTDVRLPAPLAKPAGQSAPLHVVVDPEKRAITADYDRNTHMTMALGDDGAPRRIAVQLGERGLTPPSTDGLWIGGHADQVDGIGWFNVVRHVLYGSSAEVAASNEGKASSPNADDDNGPGLSALSFLGGDLTIDRLNLDNRYVAQPHVRAQPMQSASGWRVDFEGPNSQGQITWTAEDGAPMRLAGNLKRIAIQTEDTPDDTASKTSGDTSSLIWPGLSPMNLPALAVYVQNFEVDGTNFGQTHVDAHLSDNGWHLDRFELADGALTGRMSADWQRDRGLTSAAAKAHLKGHGLSRLLRTFGYPSAVRAKNARVDADLSIEPNAAGLDLLHLNGNMHLALDDGSFPTVEPGAGRLLGLFNLYVLPRRLLDLNFRDVVDKGLAFDKVRADFLIRNGQAYSENATIKTPSSNIDIAGRIGLATRDYDERVRIQPKLGSGVTLASTVLGGPIVGAAVFAVQELLKKPIEHFSTISYRLKGNWDDPKIVDPQAETGPGEPNAGAKPDQADDSTSDKPDGS